jgi:hypothetical protein
MDRRAERAGGAFQWSRGGWFGGQLGATLWLVLLGVALLARSQPVGIVLVVLGLVPNAVGLALWRRRDTLPPYPAVQILLAVCGVSAGLALLGVALAGLPPSSAGPPSAWLLLMYPGLMAFLHLRERAARRASD